MSRAAHADGSYMRLTRTIDLSTVGAADLPALEFALSFSTELGYDNVIVEAAPAGTGQWTTLPEAGGLSDSVPPTECEAGFLLDMHPFLLNYLTPGNPCGATGTTGAWNRMTGDSGGWQQVRVRPLGLCRGFGRRVDQLRDRPGQRWHRNVHRRHPGHRRRCRARRRWLRERHQPVDDPGCAGREPGNQGDFDISDVPIEVAASVTTDDSVLVGYGIEQLATPGEQADFVGRIMELPAVLTVGGPGCRPGPPPQISSRGRRSETAGCRPSRSGASGRVDEQAALPVGAEAERRLAPSGQAIGVVALAQPGLLDPGPRRPVGEGPDHDRLGVVDHRHAERPHEVEAERLEGGHRLLAEGGQEVGRRAGGHPHQLVA